MFSFFRKKQKPAPALPDFSFLKTDIHSHLLPGIDDGAQSIEESIALLKSLQDLGFTKAITTPHVMEDFYRNTPEIIRTKLAIVKEAIKAEGLSIEIEAAAEYYMDADFSKSIEEESLLTFGDRHVLFEVSFSYPPNNLMETVFRLQVKGYKPVLAHPERYPYWQQDFSVFEKLKDTGVLFMLNSISLTGYYGKGPKVTAEKLVDKGWIDFLASDMHALKHSKALTHALQSAYLSKLCAGKPLRNPEM